MHLFWRKGYESSSLQELLQVMDLSKSSFYQAFHSKHALFQLCLQHYRRFLVQELRVQLKRSGSGKQFIISVLRQAAEDTAGPDARRGCLLMNTASEFAQADPQIAQLVSLSIESFTEIFEQAVIQAQQQGEIPPTKDARALATYLVSSKSGLMNMVKAGADRETVKRIADIVVSALV